MIIRRLPAFSLIEVVLGLLILSMVVSISVSMFEGQTEKVKSDAAREQLQVIQNALTRWQLENNRNYPFSDLKAIQSKYLENVDTDPWGNDYHVIPDQGIVYTYGPNKTDEAGEGDDYKTKYTVASVANPQPPSRLAAKPQGTSVELKWNTPTRNVDGSPIATGVGTWVYEVFVSEGQASYPATPKVTVPFGQNTWSDSGLKTKTNYYYKTRMVRVLPGKETLKSEFSNQAGTFVPGSTLPEIRRFTASSQKVPINSPFSFDVDVIDPTSNLQEVRLTFNGQTTDLLGGSGNNFHILRTFIPTNVPKTPKEVTDVQLSVRGGVPVTGLAPMTIPRIEFVNSRPVITSLRPGVITYTAQPSKKATVEFTIEARDDDRNLTKITISDPAGHSAEFEQDKVQFAVERVSWEYDLSTTATFFVTATASDDQNAASLPANAQVAIAADITPPETPVVDLNRSNACIATDDKVFAWSIRESRRVTIHADSFDAESPPVAYRVIVSTRPPSPLTSFEANAVTQDKVSKVKGWTSPITTNVFTLEYKDGGTGDLQSELQEGTFYYVGVRAQNNSVPPLLNQSVVQPKNPRTGYPQNPFVVDLTPPRITSVGIDNPGRGFVCGGATLTGRWRGEDLTRDGSKDGSGPYRYRYQVWERLTTGPTTSTSGFGRLIYDNESETTELRFALPTSTALTPNKYHMARYTLAVNVRDTSCNWSVSTSTATVIEDQTPPQLTFLSPAPLGQPQIFAPAGTLNDPNTLEGSWANVLIDADEAPYISGTDGIKSYEWGIARRCETNLPFPDIFPGDGSWRFAGTSLGDRAVRQNMLTNGDFVNVVVRAYNWAGCASSIVTCSKAVLVDTSLQVNLKASSALLYVCPQPQQVSFVGSVSGGGPSFVYRSLQPRSNPTDPDNRLSVDRTTARTVTFASPPVTYDEKDIGRRTATLEVESYTSDTAPAPNLARRADTPIICRCQPYVVSLNEGDATHQASVSILDMARTTSPLVIQMPLPIGGEKPTDLVVDGSRYSNDSTKVGAKWALVTSNFGGTARLYRVALEGDQFGGARIEQVAISNGDFFAAVDVSRDGTVAYVTSNFTDGGGPSSRVYKYALNNGFVTAAPFPLPSTAGRAGSMGGVRLTGNGLLGLAVVLDTREVDRIELPQGATTLSRGVFALLNDGMTPNVVDISPDDKTAAFTSNVTGTTKAGFLDLVRGERNGFELTGSPGETYGVRYDPLIPSRVYFSQSNRLLTYALGGDTNRITGTALAGPNLALSKPDAQLRGIDLPFDGSYVVAAAANLDQVLLLQADGRSGINPFQAGVNAFGAPLPLGPANPGFPVSILDSGKGARPIDVQVAERLAFGQPIIRFLSVTSVSQGGTLEIYGTNFTPAGIPYNAIIVNVGGKRATISGADNFSLLRIALDPTTPLGSQDVVVTNTSITSTDLRDSLPVRVNVVP